MHEMPRHTFEKGVVGQNANILRKIGVINPARLQVQHFGREQRRQSNRPRGTDNDFAETFALNVIEHPHDWRETELLQLVLR